MAAPLRDALRDRYAFERELGRGGIALQHLTKAAALDPRSANRLVAGK